ncbi:MAG: DUF4213 domain-containing protein, partial [Burkholderiaceae bacterium]
MIATSPTARPPLAHALLQQVTDIATRFAPPRVRQLHIPKKNVTPGEHDAEFCAIELQDGAFGLSYILLGNTLDRILKAHGTQSPLADADALTLAQRLTSADEVERAVALAAINALTDSVWRRIGYEPPPAG